MNDKEAMKLALEALKWSIGCMSFDDYDDMPEATAELEKAHKAIKALEEALAGKQEQGEDWARVTNHIVPLREEISRAILAEREACLKICEEQAENAYWEGADVCVEEIKKRNLKI